MEKVTKKSKIRAGKRWMLNAKVMDAVFHWQRTAEHEFAVAMEKCKSARARKELMEAGADSVGPISSLRSKAAVLAAVYHNVGEPRWATSKLPLYLSTNWVENTGHDVSSTTISELKNFLEYLTTKHHLDYVQFTLIVEEDGAMRTTKWQGHLEEEEVRALEEAVLSSL